MLAQYGVGRPGLPASGRAGTTTPTRRTAWRERHRRPGGGRGAHRSGARAERRGVQGPLHDPDGSGHQPLVPLDTIYRSFLALTTLTGCQGVNGGGWAHYVGQESAARSPGGPSSRSAWTGSARRGDDPHGVLVPPHRPVPLRPLLRRRPLGVDRAGRFEGMALRRRDRQERADGLDAVVPTFNRNPLDIADEAAAEGGRPVEEYVVDKLKSGDLRFAAEDPDSPENFPRVLAIWRANLLVGQGQRVLPQAPARHRQLPARGRVR